MQLWSPTKRSLRFFHSLYLCGYQWTLWRGQFQYCDENGKHGGKKLNKINHWGKQHVSLIWKMYVINNIKYLCLWTKTNCFNKKHIFLIHCESGGKGSSETWCTRKREVFISAKNIHEMSSYWGDNNMLADQATGKLYLLGIYSKNYFK